MSLPLPRLPLRDELYLLGHNDDTGELLLHRQALALGLAGAVLIDLFLAGRIHLGPHDSACSVTDQPIRLHSYEPVGDLIANAALSSLRHAAPPLRMWLLAFSSDLYERTRAGLVAAGILRQQSRRRLGGLIRADTYQATDSKWPVVARSRLRYLTTGREQPDNHTAALAGLTAVLGLAEHLYLDHDTAEVAKQLKAIADQHYRPVRDMTTTVDATIGDLAIAAYR
ncbi:GPP34 family phosphoprotein [Micromonospora sp. 4G57]|uniref:GPP34 family phosphoprotein n=1 Tax=Micromonospora sicca TaxID=2202420 RepID=A0ABU5JKC0_9ACTN|nr:MULTISPECIES: GPP34 family phosphoprotein [unclassified Micromonospora]MDZ5447065.1 GPP34 family phosphoprotein [Micromonospora sp. 4G57]MDZ5493058.1 GPP34 family phosphoprotein [Micromonospora sp. 4G53]